MYPFFICPNVRFKHAYNQGEHFFPRYSKKVLFSTGEIDTLEPKGVWTQFLKPSLMYRVPGCISVTVSVTVS